MKFDPPLLTEGPLSRRVYVVTHGKREPHPTIPGEGMVIASVKYDVTVQFEALAAKRVDIPHITHGRHCSCSACARQDWAESGLASCGMHGLSCPPVYDPWGRAGDLVPEGRLEGRLSPKVLS